MHNYAIPKRIFFEPHLGQYQSQGQHPKKRQQAEVHQEKKKGSDINGFFLVQDAQQFLHEVAPKAKLLKNGGENGNRNHHDVISIRMGAVQAFIGIMRL